ncbi:uncharacterized protein LOC129947833 [Eupeodes corollae]|uniref:uncharacterized protein LOC129947833 n=1 Tax=Eupeodes corollae TaxID=290404 RepID=UPI0024926F12|nr:uncharacterized protein LOC129947833 [Eupeodes corollae]
MKHRDSWYIEENGFNSNRPRPVRLSRQTQENFYPFILTVRDLGEDKCCLGIQIKTSPQKIQLSQSGYIEDVLKRFGMENSKPVATPTFIDRRLLNDSARSTEDQYEKPYRELLGELMYLALAKRPDIAYSVSALS